MAATITAMKKKILHHINIMHTIKSSIGISMALTGILCIIGCTSPTYHSHRVHLSKRPPHGGEGMAYFLPTGYIHFVAELQESNTVSGKTTEGQKAGDSKTNKVEAVEVEPMREPLPGSADVPKGTNQPPKPPGKDQENPAKVRGYTIKVEALLSPDPSKLFLLQPATSRWAHDTFGISVSNGLLTSINSSNTDQSGKVLVKLAELAGDIVQLAGGKFAPAGFKPKLSTELPTRIDIIINPEKSHEYDGLFARANLRLDIAPFDWGENAKESKAKREEVADGIFYRPLLPWKITVQDTNSDSFLSSMVMLPNRAPMLCLKPSRTALVSAKTSITFSQGSPTSFSYDRESPYLALASLPVDMIKAFLSAPTELIQLKLNYVNTNGQFIKSQADELQNQLKLLQQQLAVTEYLRTNNAHK